MLPLAARAAPTAPPSDAGWLAPENRRTLAAILPDARWVLEVGSFCGLSARHILDTHTKASIVCVDLWDRGFPYFPHGHPPIETFAASCWAYRDRIYPVREDSATALPRLLRSGFRPDFVYIDGGHEYVEAAFDIHHALRFGVPVVGDDFAPDWPGVVEAVLQCARDHRAHIAIDGRCWVLTPPAAATPAPR